MYWLDKYGVIIKAGDKLHNPYDREPFYEVLSDDKGNLYLGDMESPFSSRYCFDEFWQVIK